jgi:two-component system invasion response regulator UvrY
MIRIVIVDDHSIVRKGLISMFADSGDITCVAETRDGPEAMRALRQVECDAVVLDVSLPGKHGIEVLKQIKKEWPRLPVLMLSSHPEDQYAIRAMRAGASGYMNKSAAAEDLNSALRLVAAGRRYITPELAEQLADRVENPSDAPLHEKLSDREFQTLRMIGSGLSSTQIAERLFLSVKTVSVYRARLLEKLHLHTNAELTRYAIENDLAEFESRHDSR